MRPMHSLCRGCARTVSGSEYRQRSAQHWLELRLDSERAHLFEGSPRLVPLEPRVKQSRQHLLEHFALQLLSLIHI